jgi:hypothetical protein
VKEDSTRLEDREQTASLAFAFARPLSGRANQGSNIFDATVLEFGMEAVLEACHGGAYILADVAPKHPVGEFSA